MYNLQARVVAFAELCGSSFSLWFTQNLVHRFALGQFVDQLIEIANFPHRRFFDFFNSNTANQTLDQSPQRIHRRGIGKKCFKVCFLRQLSFQFALGVSGEPKNDFIYLTFRPSLFFCLCKIKGIDAGETRCVDSMFLHDRCLCINDTMEYLGVRAMGFSEVVNGLSTESLWTQGQ